MHLTHITFTGADDSVDPQALAALSARYPLIEWGILISRQREGTPRYPSAEWRKEFYRVAPEIRRAAHLCGRETLSELARSSPGLRNELSEYQRVQLNFNAETFPPPILRDLVSEWRNGQLRSRHGSFIEYVTQHNESNAEVYKYFADHWIVPHMNHAVLFDASAGEGVSPTSWPAPLPGVPCGYAGGLKPETLPTQLDAIMAAVRGGTSTPDFIWIDMETGARTCNQFDLQKVTAALDSLATRVRFADQRHGDMTQECRYVDDADS